MYSAGSVIIIVIFMNIASVPVVVKEVHDQDVSANDNASSPSPRREKWELSHLYLRYAPTVARHTQYKWPHMSISKVHFAVRAHERSRQTSSPFTPPDAFCKLLLRDSPARPGGERKSEQNNFYSSVT